MSLPKHRVKHIMYKDQGAVHLELVPPTFRGSPDGFQVVDRKGCMLLYFAPPAQSADRRYNSSFRSFQWDQKIVFSVQATELGVLLAGGSKVELFHDSGYSGSQVNQRRKTFRQEEGPEGSVVWSVTETSRAEGSTSASTTELSVPLNAADVQLVRSIVQYAAPRLLGFTAVFGEDAFGSA